MGSKGDVGLLAVVMIFARIWTDLHVCSIYLFEYACFWMDRCINGRVLKILCLLIYIYVCMYGCFCQLKQIQQLCSQLLSGFDPYG